MVWICDNRGNADGRKGNETTKLTENKDNKDFN